MSNDPSLELIIFINFKCGVYTVARLLWKGYLYNLAVIEIRSYKSGTVLSFLNP